jgi:orotidine-5'-phosphate decarboxylase
MKDKWNARVDAIDSLLCVGLDPLFAAIPPEFHAADFPSYEFNRYIIDQTHEFVSAYKLNTAFYESQGEIGWKELRMTMEYLRAHHPSIVTICDAKRGDIGHTNTQYCRAIFDVLGFDAVTLNPFVGRDALMPFLERVDKASIILCRTTDTGSQEFQELLVDGVPLWLKIASNVSQHWNTLHNCMLVIGASFPEQLRQARAIIGEMTVLVPGFGAQGGNLRDVMSAGLVEGRGLVLNVGRSVIYAKDPAQEARELRDSINVLRALP